MALVVTGTSSGLGEAVVARLVEEGMHVVAIDLNGDAGAQLEKQYRGQVAFFRADVCNEDQVQKAIDGGVSTFGSIRGLINCAGVGRPKRILSSKGHVHSMRDFEFVVRVNLFGSFNVLRLVAAQMAKQDADEHGDRGVIINTASVAAYDGQIGQASYSASKAAIAGMTLPLARDLAKYGIRVVTVAPGIFETPMMASLPEKARRSLMKQVPHPSRLGRPDEFASFCLTIIRNQYLNGETIRLDGAIRMAAM